MSPKHVTHHRGCDIPESSRKFLPRASPPLHKSKADEREREDATVDGGEASATHHWIHHGIPERERQRVTASSRRPVSITAAPSVLHI